MNAVIVLWAGLYGQFGNVYDEQRTLSVAARAHLAVQQTLQTASDIYDIYTNV